MPLDMQTAETALPDTSDEVTAAAAAPPALLQWPNTAAVIGKEAVASQSLEASVDWSSHAHNTGQIEVHSCMQVALMHGAPLHALYCPQHLQAMPIRLHLHAVYRSAVLLQIIGQSLGGCWELLGQLKLDDDSGGLCTQLHHLSPGPECTNRSMSSNGNGLTA